MGRLDKDRAALVQSFIDEIEALGYKAFITSGGGVDIHYATGEFIAHCANIKDAYALVLEQER